MLSVETSSPGVIPKDKALPGMGGYKILVIEDDPGGRMVLLRGLTECGHETAGASDFAEGLALAGTNCFDALIVDRKLPGGDGLDIVTALRARRIMTPAIFLTGLGDVSDRIAGLRAGGDDYIAKPFSFLELLARLEAVMRRNDTAPETVLRVGDVEMDLIARTVKRAGTEIALMPREFQLLEFLMRRPGQIVTRAMLLEGVWQCSFDPETKIIDVQVSRLRQKIDRDTEKTLIHTVRGSLAAVLTPLPDAAAAYDTGKLTCEQVGMLAKSIVESKQRGLSLPTAVAITNIVKAGHERERQIVEDIATEIYTAPHGEHLTPGGALTAYVARCRAPK
jgi:two-component system, OmpR family, response regulator